MNFHERSFSHMHSQPEIAVKALKWLLNILFSPEKYNRSSIGVEKQ